MNIPEKSRVPEHIFRYRRIDDYTIDREIQSIKTKSIYGSAFFKMNDPMEGIYEGIFKNNPNSPIADIIGFMSNDKTKKRICSFSQDYDSDLMWAHYAGQFQGICIRYDTSLIDKHVTNNDVSLFRVIYAKNPLRITDVNEESVIKILTQKSITWRNEREWRILFSKPLIQGNDSGCLITVGSSISRVYFGVRIKEEHKEAIKACISVDYPSATFRDMRLDGYKLRFPE